MRDRSRYSQIRSLSQLREEQIKVENEIRYKEMQMRVEYSNFRESISITRFLTIVVTRISVILPFIKTARKVYEYIVTQLRSFRDKSSQESSSKESAKENDNMSSEEFIEEIIDSISDNKDE